MSQSGNDIMKDVMLRSAPSFAAIPFLKVENVEDTLFDSHNLKLSKDEIDEKINFLKKTKVSDIEFGIAALLTIRNKNTGESITASNRGSRHELRGANLRQAIEDAQTQNPDQTAYDALNRHLHNPKYVDVVIYAKSSACQPDLNTSITETHFNTYVGLLLGEVKENSYVAPGVVVPDPEAVGKAVVRDIDLGKLYDLSLNFSNVIENIYKREDEFFKAGKQSAVIDLQEITKDLHTQEHLLFAGDISNRQFSKNVAQIQTKLSILEPIHATHATDTTIPFMSIEQTDEHESAQNVRLPEDINQETVTTTDDINQEASSTQNLNPVNMDSHPVTADINVLDELDQVLNDTMAAIEQLDKAFDIAPPVETQNSSVTQSYKRALDGIKQGGEQEQQMDLDADSDSTPELH